YDVMQKIIEESIKEMAKEISEKHKISDIDRVFNILKKTAIDNKATRLEDTEDFIDDGSFTFIPSLWEALALFPPDRALEIFETSDLDDLFVKCGYISNLLDLDTPFYTHQELLELIIRFKKYCLDNKPNLLWRGYPLKCFNSSAWFYCKLSRLYPIKIPGPARIKSFADQKIVTEKGFGILDNERDIIFFYKWIKEALDDQMPLRQITPCSYIEAPLINGFTDKDIEHIEENRIKIFELKLRLLDIAHNYISNQNNIENYWEDCINLICEKLSVDDIQLFNNIEEKYADLSLLYVLYTGSSFMSVFPASFDREIMNAGGIKNLLEFIFLIEEELKIGLMHHTKTELLKLTDNQMPSISYFEFLSFNNIEEIDNAIYHSISYFSDEKDMHSMFYKRLAEDFQNKFKIQLSIPSELVSFFSNIIKLREEGEKIGIDINYGIVKHVVAGQKIVPFDLPENVKWEDITITFTDDEYAKINAKGFKGSIKERHFKDMGFGKMNSNKPCEQWLMLLKFAEHDGIYKYALPFKKTPKEKSPIEIEEEFDDETMLEKLALRDKEAGKKHKRKKKLTQILQSLFPNMKGDPIEIDEYQKIYKIKIKLSPPPPKFFQ
ncbi:MAG TPA: hypothetical protein VJ438_05905, partial [Candidatus Nanoarchaeia archaeon]|nr:hypothetical protein [Candidatus Nanoarchaeia archaeon]